MPTQTILIDPLPAAQRREALRAYSRAAFQTTAGLAVAALGLPLLVAGPIAVLAMLGGVVMAVVGLVKAVDAARKVRTTLGVVEGWLAQYVNRVLDFTG